MSTEYETIGMDMCDIEIGDITLLDYAYGHCDTFAMALVEQFDYEMHVVWNLNRAYGDKRGKGIVHAYAVARYKDQTFYFDAHGNVTYEDIQLYLSDECDSEVDEPVFKTEVISDIQGFKQVKIKLAEQFGHSLTLDKINSDITEVISYLEKNKGSYSIKDKI